MSFPSSSCSGAAVPAFRASSSSFARLNSSRVLKDDFEAAGAEGDAEAGAAPLAAADDDDAIPWSREGTKGRRKREAKKKAPSPASARAAASGKGSPLLDGRNRELKGGDNEAVLEVGCDNEAVLEVGSDNFLVCGEVLFERERFQ